MTTLTSQLILSFLVFTRAFQLRTGRLALGWNILQHRIGSIPEGRVENIDRWVAWSSDSLFRLTGQTLLEKMQIDSIPQVHSHTRYAVLSHGTQDDPIFHYFNRAALETFEYTEGEVYKIPSRYSAPDGAARSVRDKLIGEATQAEVLNLYDSIRITKSGKLFMIKHIVLWNVYDDDGVRVGQTAIYDRDLITPFTKESDL